MYKKTQAITDIVLDEVRNERVRQTRKHGEQYHLPDGTGPDGTLLEELVTAVGKEGVMDNERLAEAAKARCDAAAQNGGGNGSITFEHILTEEYAEAISEKEKDKLYDELVQVAAVAVQWLEKIRLEEGY